VKNRGHWFNKYDLIVATTLTVLTVLFCLFFVKGSFTIWPADATEYFKMAQNPFDPQVAMVPFVYRIGVPYLVHYLFGGSIWGFILIKILSFWTCLYLIMKIARLFTSDKIAKAFVSVIFATAYSILFQVANVAVLDVSSYVFIFALLYIFFTSIDGRETIDKKTWILFAVVLLLGTLVREWTIFVVPILIVYVLFTGSPGNLMGDIAGAARQHMLDKMHRVRRALVIVLCTVPAGAEILFIRFLMKNSEGAQTFYNYWPYNFLQDFWPLNIDRYWYLFQAFGAFWMVVPIAVIYCYKNSRKEPALYVLPVLALMLALFFMTIDGLTTNRMLFYMFPFLIPALSIYLSKLNEGISSSWLSILFLVMFLLVRFAVNYRAELVGAFRPDAVQLVVCVVIETAVLVAYIVMGSRRRRNPGSNLT
jgi:hypothetical protein